MRFGHYTVFDTPEENKHTQVYVEYDVPNNDDLDGATGTIVLTEGGQGSGGGEEGNGIKSITISPAITTIPTFESLFPVYYEDLTEDEKGTYKAVSAVATTTLVDGNEYTVTVTPTENMFVADGNGIVSASEGAPITFNVDVEEGRLFFRVTAIDSISEAPAMMFTANVDAYNE